MTFNLKISVLTNNIGATAGATESFVVVPFELVKIRSVLRLILFIILIGL